MKLRIFGLCIALAVCGCKKTQVAHTVGLALDVGGRGDQSFNDGALRGVEIMAKPSPARSATSRCPTRSMRRSCRQI